MAKTLTEEFAGPIYQATACTRCKKSDLPAQRAAKKNKTSEKQKLLNKKNASRELRNQLAATFPSAGSAIVMTLTYDNKHLPKKPRPGDNRDKVSEHVQSFLDRLRKKRKAAGLPMPVAFWSIEALSAKNSRWHVHMVIDNTGQDYEMIRKAWLYGDITEFTPLRTDKVKNWETQAKYMTKESRECQDDRCRPGLKSWSHTRNIKYPERRTRIVPDSYVIPIPQNAENVSAERSDTDFGLFEYVSYWLMEAWHRPKPKAKRVKKS